MEIELPEIPIGPPTGFPDTAQIPLLGEILNELTLSVQDDLIQSKLEDQFKELTQTLNVGDSPGSGHLFSVNVFFGGVNGKQVLIPDGQILSSVGAGFNPFDAFARQINQGTITALRPTGASDHSSFIWIQRLENGNVKASHIARAGREPLIKLAKKEAVRQKRLKSFFATGKLIDQKRVNVAEYWAEQYKVRRRGIKSAETRKRIRELNSSMRKAQERLNDAIAKHQDVVQRMNDRADQLAMIQAVSQITAILKFGVDAEKIFSEPSKNTPKTPVKDGGQPLIDPKNASQIHLNHHGELNGTRIEYEIKASSETDSLRVLEKKILEQIIDQIIPIDQTPLVPDKLDLEEPKPLPIPFTPKPPLG